MNAQILIGLFFAHWIGDFVLQSDWMARNKSKNWTALTLHVLTYAGVLSLFAAVIAPMPPSRFFAATAQFVGLNFALHFVTDAITSRITAKLYAANQIHCFFVVVGFDQWIHATCLILTLPILL